VTALLNIGRLLMVAWILYALYLLFSPHFFHTPPHDLSAAAQAVGAFALGYLMDRVLGLVRRRRAARLAADLPVPAPGSI
jgi:hypothetical protein